MRRFACDFPFVKSAQPHAEELTALMCNGIIKQKEGADMDRLRDGFRRHPRITTVLHVVLAALPLTLVVMFFLGLAGVFITGQETFYGWLLFFMFAGIAAFFSTGAIWLMSLLLYRFTHAVRENWPDRLRMSLIRLNIVGGLLTIVQLWLWVQWLLMR